MASSSTSFVSNQVCCCELPLKVLTSWTPGNPARRFLVCPNQSKPVKKICDMWLWFDPKIECDWYRIHWYEMYIQLNPQQRRLMDNAISRQRRIEDLEADLNERNVFAMK
nr:DNA-(apurinic or apyrimidinic site) lyase 2 [Tanacetum cinerariifolium]GEW77629.1 DNA-(apurinic or apyrimidinic site) lyase 2 [Tanacetum cinerariifolium]